MEGLGLTLPNPDFWSGQRVLLTGHTGFKGSWAALWLERLGAAVHGYALAPDQTPDLWTRVAPVARLEETIADIADAPRLAAVVATFRPTLVLHMAAQPLVRRSYAEPAATFAANVQGTVNLLEAARTAPDLRAVLVVTTDKVYRHGPEPRRFDEADPLGGDDPYSASKAAAELVVASYRASFFAPAGVRVATARAGNVIGGGDWSADRLVPDIWRALHAGRPLELRHPAATRPWQHVLDPLAGYLLHLEALAAGHASDALNFGPAEIHEITVAEVADALAHDLGLPHGWTHAPGDHPPEMRSLALDASLASRVLAWRPRLPAAQALAWTADWYRRFDRGEPARSLCEAQLAAYEALP